jgi:hypothetical protein
MTGLEAPSGSATTGDWVSDGMMFYLQDASSGDSSGASNTIANVRIQVTAGSSSGIRQGTLVATPNPIRLQSGQSYGTAALSWRATGVTRVQVRVGSPNGTPLTGFETPTGSALTGNWVTNGLTFYLQDASSGDSSGAARTLSAVTVRVL